MSEVEEEEVKWLWYPFIPFGKITILEGDPGEGKTTVILRIISEITRGEPVGGFQEAREPFNVLFQTAEDGLADTIKPRLVNAKADCSYVLVIDESKKALTMSDERLEEALILTKAKLLVLDPIQGYIGSDVDMHRANEIRPVMKRLSVLAEKYECAVVLIGHLNKSSLGKSNYRGLGSIDFHAAARSVLLVGRVKDDPETRVICQVKSSLAPEVSPYAFRLTEKGFEWIGEYEITADELMSGLSKETKIEQAKTFLKDYLSDGMKASNAVRDAAIAQGIKFRTMLEAKKQLGIDSIKYGGKWYYLMEDDDDEE